MSSYRCFYCQAIVPAWAPHNCVAGHGRPIRLRYNPRRRANDVESRPWSIWLRGWVGPFKTALGAATLQIDEPYD